jgi:hypothetical protein
MERPRAILCARLGNAIVDVTAARVTGEQIKCWSVFGSIALLVSCCEGFYGTSLMSLVPSGEGSGICLSRFVCVNRRHELVSFVETRSLV